MPHLILTVNNIAGIGVNLFVLIIAIKSGKCPSLAPTKNNLDKSKTQNIETKAKQYIHSVIGLKVFFPKYVT